MISRVSLLVGPVLLLTYRRKTVASTRGALDVVEHEETVSCWPVSLKCLLVREQCEENKVVSKCRAERGELQDWGMGQFVEEKKRV